MKYHVSTGFGFSPKASGFYPFGDATDLVRGWRRDCVVGGMETRFQCRKAHNPYAKCEAFHIAPRLFFMFLFLIPFTIRQHCIIYPQEFSTEPQLLYIVQDCILCFCIWWQRLIFGITKMEAALFYLEKESLHLCRLTSILHSHATYQFNDVGKFRLNDL